MINSAGTKFCIVVIKTYLNCIRIIVATYCNPLFFFCFFFCFGMVYKIKFTQFTGIYYEQSILYTVSNASKYITFGLH